MLFKKLGMLLLVVFLMGGQASIAHARLSGGANTMQSEVAISSTSPNTSSYIDLDEGEYFGIWYQSSSTLAGVDVKLEFLMSHDTTAANFVEPEGVSDIVSSLTDELPHVERLSLPPMRYLKIKATGNAATSTDTWITTIVFMQNNKE